MTVELKYDTIQRNEEKTKENGYLEVTNEFLILIQYISIKIDLTCLDTEIILVQDQFCICFLLVLKNRLRPLVLLALFRDKNQTNDLMCAPLTWCLFLLYLLFHE